MRGEGGRLLRALVPVRRHSLAVGWAFIPAFALLIAVAVIGVFPPWERPFLGRELREGFPAGQLLTGGVIWGVAIALIFFLIERATALVRWRRGGPEPVRPFAALRRFGIQRGHRIVAVALGVVILWAFMPLFLSLKAVIPDLQAFGPWDRRFIALDRILHLGRDPWRWIHPVVGHPAVTVVLDRVYLAWILFLPIGFLTFTFWLSGVRRIQFVMSYLLTWVLLGVGAATLFASVGPCFVALMGGLGNPYGELMSYLEGVHAMRPLTALELQEELWTNYREGTVSLTTGIAAMPSLHVAISSLYAIAVWHRSRLVSGALWVFAVLVLLGSVHLGWHYAIDGYASLLVIAPIWFGSGWLMKRWRELDPGARRRSSEGLAVS